MAKETVRYPDFLASYVAKELVGRHFGSKSKFYRFASQYTLDALGVEDEDVFEEEYWDKKEDFEELLEKSDLPVVRPRRRGEDAIDKIYAGHIMDNARMLREGVEELAGMVDSDLEDYAAEAWEEARKKMSNIE